jgi:hypothetical protein
VYKIPRSRSKSTAALTVWIDTPASAAILFWEGSREPGGNSPEAMPASIARATCSWTHRSSPLDIPLQSGTRNE